MKRFIYSSWSITSYLYKNKNKIINNIYILKMIWLTMFQKKVLLRKNVSNVINIKIFILILKIVNLLKKDNNVNRYG